MSYPILLALVPACHQEDCKSQHGSCQQRSENVSLLDPPVRQDFCLLVFSSDGRDYSQVQRSQCSHTPCAATGTEVLSTL